METYLVRIWEPAEKEVAAGEIRGFVQRARDGREQPFVGIEQLLERLAIPGSSDGEADRVGGNGGRDG